MIDIDKEVRAFLVKFGEVLKDNDGVMNTLTLEELESALDPKNYLGSTEKIIENIVSQLK